MKYFISLLCIIHSLYSFSIFDALSEQTISLKTESIFYRYYLIQRCDTSISFLLNNVEIWDKIKKLTIKPTNFNHIAIQDKIHEDGSCCSKNTLSHLWETFSAQKHLMDPDFEHDFITLIFILLHQTTCISFQKNIISIDDSSSDIDILNSIDHILDTASCSHTKLHRLPSNNHISTNDIAFNYYFCKRLAYSMEILEQLHNKNIKFHPTRSFNKNSPSEREQNIFHHETLQEYSTAVCIEETIEPVLELWQHCTHFRHTGDQQFFKEMLMMIFMVYKDLLLQDIHQESEITILSEINAILELYEHLDEMPMNKILEAIDIATEKLLSLEKNERFAPQSWQSSGHCFFLPALIICPIIYYIIKIHNV